MATNPQPLSTLLSQVLVAFTIEFDNEAEHRLPHRTTDHGATPGSLHAPWLVSMAMWFNCMRFVGEEGITVRDLERAARTPTNLAGMQRWGYVTVGPDPAHRQSPKSTWLIRATLGGQIARKIWEPLFGEIERRWEERFGKAAIPHLKSLLETFAGQLDPDLPDSLPILGYGLRNADRLTKLLPVGTDAGATNAMPALLARVLLAFALDFEREAEISLAIYANLLRVLDENGIRVRDLPAISGVSKESLNMATGLLGKKGLVRVESRGKAVKFIRLTSAGIIARDRHQRLLAEIENGWRARFGASNVAGLREVLGEMAGDGTLEHSPLVRGLRPYPEGWRASVAAAATLPHFPMVLHRGGYPDGS